MSKLPRYGIEVVHEGANIVGESPMWHPIERALYWVDTRRPALHRLNRDRTVRTWPMPTNIGSYVFRRGGGLVAGLKHGFCTVDQATGAVERILDPEADLPEDRLNDGRCDRRGRYWCGSRDPGNENPGGSLYRLDPDFRCQKMDSGFIVSNGMAFSPDDRTFVFGDSRGDTIWRHDLDLDAGTLANKRVFLDTIRDLGHRVPGGGPAGGPATGWRAAGRPRARRARRPRASCSAAEASIRGKKGMPRTQCCGDGMQRPSARRHTRTRVDVEAQVIVSRC